MMEPRKYTYQVTVQHSGMVIMRMFHSAKWMERTLTVSRLASLDHIEAAKLDVVKKQLDEMEAELDRSWGDKS